MRVLITGARGFVGSRLMVSAIKQGHEVVGTERQKDPQRTANPSQQVETADLTRRDEVARVIDLWQPEVILHTAARIPRVVNEDAFTFIDDNVLATVNVLDCAQKAGVKQVVLSSTMSVYGLPSYLPVDEQHPLEPEAAYGLSKLEGEMYGKLYARSGNMRVTVLRYSGIYGQGQKSGAVPTFITRCLTEQTLTLYSEGRPSSDYVWVEDVVCANLLTLQPNNLPGFQVFNIGSGVELPIRELAETIRGLCDSKSTIHLSDLASPRDFRFAYDISKARSELGYKPTPPDQSLRLCVEQWKQGQW